MRGVDSNVFISPALSVVPMLKS